MKTLLILAVCLIVGCGSGGGSSNSNISAKSLWSRWVSDNGNTIDLRNGSLGQPLLWFVVVSGDTCVCDITASGTETQGNYSISSCNITTAGPTDCSVFEEVGTFSNDGSALAVCENGAGSCVVYR